MGQADPLAIDVFKNSMEGEIFMTVFGVNIYLDESQIDKYRNDKEFQKETINKVKKSMLKAFEENLEENLFVDEKTVDNVLEVEYLAGFADKKKLKEAYK